MTRNHRETERAMEEVRLIAVQVTEDALYLRLEEQPVEVPALMTCLTLILRLRALADAYQRSTCTATREALFQASEQTINTVAFLASYLGSNASDEELRNRLLRWREEFTFRLTCEPEPEAKPTPAPPLAVAAMPAATWSSEILLDVRCIPDGATVEIHHRHAAPHETAHWSVTPTDPHTTGLYAPKERP